MPISTWRHACYVYQYCVKWPLDSVLHHADPWLVTTNLRKIEGAGPFCKTSCFLDRLHNVSCLKCHAQAISCDSSAYTMHPLLLYIIIVVHDTVNDVIKPSYINVCILVQKVIIRNINYVSDRMRPWVTSMHYLCCLSFLSVCSFTNDIFAVGIFIEA